MKSWRNKKRASEEILQHINETARIATDPLTFSAQTAENTQQMSTELDHGLKHIDAVADEANNVHASITNITQLVTQLVENGDQTTDEHAQKSF